MNLKNEKMSLKFLLKLNKGKESDSQRNEKLDIFKNFKETNKKKLNLILKKDVS